MNQLDERSKNNMKGVHPNLQLVMSTAILNCPVAFTIVEGVRTLEKQKEYYSWGRTINNPNTAKMTRITTCDGVVRKSNHQIKADGYGYAFDLYPKIDGRVKITNVAAEQKLIAGHIKKTADELGFKIVWGGDWKNPFDPPHFELK